MVYQIGILVAGAFIITVGRWGRDMYRNMRILQQSSGAVEMALLDRRMALADVLIVAALADGDIDPEEAGTLKELAADESELAEELEAARERWHPRLAALAEPEARIAAMRTALLKLGASDRAALAKLVTEGPESADEPTATAPQQDHASHYRVGQARAGDLRAELRAALAG